MTSRASRRDDAVRYMSVPAGAFVARLADSHGHRPQKHLDLRKRSRTTARLGQLRIIEAEASPGRGRMTPRRAACERRSAGTYDLLVLLFGATYFFAELGPNATTFVFPPSSCVQIFALVAAKAWTRDNCRCFKHRVRAWTNASVARPAIPGWPPHPCVP